MERKRTHGAELKEASEGHVVAVIATFGVKDHDGDITLPGAFGQQDVPMVYGHDWGSVPIGKGVVREDGNVALFDGQFNMDIQRGEEAFRSVKFMGGLQEWSYGFSVNEGGAQRKSDARYLQPTPEGKAGLTVHETSPVLVGAGIGTGTVLVKNRENTLNLIEALAQNGDEAAKAFIAQVAKEADEAAKLKAVDHATQVLAQVEALASRAEDIKRLREEKDGTLGTEFVNRLAAVKDRLDELLTSVEVKENVSPLRAEFLRYQQTLAHQNGVAV